MSTLTISRKPKGLCRKPLQAQQKEPESDISINARHYKPNELNRSKRLTGRKTKAAKARDRKMMRLIKFWSELFSIDEPKPLKIGVLADLQNSIDTRGIEFGAGSLKAALMGYTRRYQYQKALSAGGLRYGINGTPCGEVSVEQQQNALDALKKKRMEGRKDGQG
ncbi:proQ/FINO family protein [Salmonella enterica subsp. enterica]|nr:proQ/FINO family protein [Salmonella enterica subsp. enterica]